MKYIKVISGIPFKKFKITNKDLVDLKEGFSDLLINLSNDTYFDYSENDWKSINLSGPTEEELEKGL